MRAWGVGNNSVGVEFLDGGGPARELISVYVPCDHRGGAEDGCILCFEGERLDVDATREANR